MMTMGSTVLKKMLVLSMVCAMTLTLGCGSGNSAKDSSSNANKKITLKLAHNFPASHPLAKGADEFAKNGDAKVGTMRSASQGTFDILPANGSAEDSIGGVYDKSTVKKIARVVVTIEYNTQP